MIVVVSQARTKPGEEHARAYLELNDQFGDWFRDHPGFRGRQVVRGVEDRQHFTHLRWFDTVESYEQCTRRPGYVEHTERMYAHLEPYDSYPREFLTVELHDAGPATR